MRIFFALMFIMIFTGAGEASLMWVNNISISEYNMTWSYNETFSGADSIAFRMNIDTDLGDNDSFVNAWELLKIDKEMRRRLRESIDKEQDVKINNGTQGLEIVDVGSKLSPDIIGKTHSFDAITNKYAVIYKFKESIFNASSIWFLGQANTSVTFSLPAGLDVVNISGMDNIAQNITDHIEISGSFKGITKDRGEIILNVARNTSVLESLAAINNTPLINGNNASKNATGALKGILPMIRDSTIIIAAIMLIILIYMFKLKNRP